MLKYRKIRFLEAISCCSSRSTNYVKNILCRFALLAVSYERGPVHRYFVNISSYKYLKKGPSYALQAFETSALPAHGKRYIVSQKNTVRIIM